MIVSLSPPSLFCLPTAKKLENFKNLTLVSLYTSTTAQLPRPLRLVYRM